MRKVYTLLLLSLLIIFNQNISICKFNNGTHAELYETEVFFKISDTTLQKIFDEASKKAERNLKYFDKYLVLIEGGGYNNVWLETQPMGGVMYAKRNIVVAKNNIEIFIDYQRNDGRMPGMIGYHGDTLNPYYGWLQGYCFPKPAYELYFLIGKDMTYLKKLYKSLENFDEYLWKTRDSDNDGCLETWCVWDTGEDFSTRYGGAPNSWPFDFPPTKDRIQQMPEKDLQKYCNIRFFDTLSWTPVPMESMNIMSYSYSCRDVLSLISKEIKNGKENYWRKKANDLSTKIKDYLWVSKKQACFDKDKTNKTIDVLSINNLLCMYFGSFDQEMADNFIQYHLLNPQEFWTQVPLTSIAVNDSFFRNDSGNNWSGQPQGLTFQRSIRALENYGHYSELSIIAKKFLNVIGDSLKFTQQYDPYKGTSNTSTDYGPSILASLEFISRLYGIYLTEDQIYWSCTNIEDDYSYTQKWGSKIYQMEKEGNLVTCSINGEKIFSFSKGVRLVSDNKGNLLEIVGIDVNSENIEINYHNKEYKLIVEPNSIYKLNSNRNFYKSKSVQYFQ